MESHKLGGTELSVSAFGMGCGNFGGIGSAPEFFGQGESEEEAFVLLDQAIDLGINYLDTADAYGGGRSEATIGKWLAKKDSSIRDHLLISSKVAYPVGDDLDQEGLSRQHIFDQIDASLTRLGVDHLDMYLAHRPDPNTPLDETLDAFDALISNGKVRYVGTSQFPAPLLFESLEVAKTNGHQRFEWVQNSFNLIDQQDQSEILDLCRDHGLGFTNFSPLQGGWLTGKYKYDQDYPEGSRMTKRPEPYLKYWNQDTFDRIDRLSDMAAEARVSPAGLSLGWLYHHPVVTSSIIGPRRATHFEPVREAIELDLSQSDWESVGAIFTEDDG